MKIIAAVTHEPGAKFAIENVELQEPKMGEILVKVLSMTPRKLQTIQPKEFKALAKDFNVTLPKKFLYEKPF